VFFSLPLHTLWPEKHLISSYPTVVLLVLFDFLIKTASTRYDTMPAAAAAATDKKDEKVTKRQQRKQPNTKNLWAAQLPKLQGADARSKAYLRVAGFNNTKATAATLSPDAKFGRLLGGTDQRIRHTAVLQLRNFLKAKCSSTGAGISELELMKLWKGLWYTLYMADQVPVQEELSAKLAELLWSFEGSQDEDEYAAQAYLEMTEEEERTDSDDGSDEEEDEVEMEELKNTLESSVDDDEEDSSGSKEQPLDDDSSASSSASNNSHDNNCEPGCHHDHDDDYYDTDSQQENDETFPHYRGAHLAALFVRAYFSTVQREWGNMDKYRIDKFYTLTRNMLRQIFLYMAKRHWNFGIVRLFNDVIFEQVLSKTPNGLRFHLLDIVLDELVQVDAPTPLTEATFLDCLEPYFALAQTGCGDDVVQQRAVENVLLTFLYQHSVVSETASNDDEEAATDKIFHQVHVGTVAQFIFDIASDGSTKDKYRKSLYDAHKKYMRRLKQVGRDVELKHEDMMDENRQNDHDNEQAGDREVEDASDDEQAFDAPELKAEVADTNGSNNGETADSGPQVEESERKKKSKKKKKKEKKKAQESVQQEPPKADDTDRENVSAKNELPIAGNAVSEQAPEKKFKRNKKKSNESAAKPLPDQDEEITISLADQQSAKAAQTPKRKLLESPESVDEHGNKRVKFTNANRARSYNASMKGLRTTDPSPKAKPEVGILRNKGAPSLKAKSIGRKKAIDYF
jgi:hypothetical protein